MFKQNKKEEIKEPIKTFGKAPVPNEITMTIEELNSKLEEYAERALYKKKFQEKEQELENSLPSVFFKISCSIPKDTLEYIVEFNPRVYSSVNHFAINRKWDEYIEKLEIRYRESRVFPTYAKAHKFIKDYRKMEKFHIEHYPRGEN